MPSCSTHCSIIPCLISIVIYTSFIVFFIICTFYKTTIFLDHCTINSSYNFIAFKAVKITKTLSRTVQAICCASSAYKNFFTHPKHYIINSYSNIWAHNSYVFDAPCKPKCKWCTYKSHTKQTSIRKN